MKLIPFCIVASLSICICVAQSQYIKLITPINNTVTISDINLVKPTDDNGFVVLSPHEMSLMKFNECSDFQWGSKYTPSFDYGFTDMVEINQHYYILSGDITESKFAITKIDPSVDLSSPGITDNIVWNIQYTDNAFDHVPYAIKKDNDGNIIFLGNIKISGIDYKLLVKINSNGNIIWSKKYNLDDTSGDFIVTSDDGILFTTYNNIVKVDRNGNVEWCSTKASNNYFYYEPIEVSDGYIINSNDILHKLDKNGNKILSVRSQQNSYHHPKIKKRTNNTFIKVINIDYPVQYVVVLELDKNFNILSQKFINGNDYLAYSACVLHDSSCIISSNDFFGATPSSYITKFQPNIQSVCVKDTNVFQFSPIPITGNTISQNVIVSNHTLNTQTTLLTTDRELKVQESVICNTFTPYFLSLGNDTTICENTPFTISPQIDYLANSYLWSTGETTSSISVNQSGTYWLEITVNCGKDTLRDSIDVMTYEPAYFSLGEDRKTCLNENSLISLDAPLCDNCSFLWSDGNSSSTTSINREGTYWLEVTNENGCITTDSIDVICDCSYTLPNIFTPNEDHINDSFLNGMGTHYEQFEIQLYNRWGRLIYSSEEVTDKLNLLSDGTYYYNLTYTDYCTQTNTEKGWVEIRK